MLTEIRLHGRAGQGIVTAAELLAVAAGFEGRHSQAFPFFGSEKRGPPVAGYCRISDAPIEIHEQVYNPDIVIVCDDTILDIIDVASGLKPNGVVLINTSKKPSELGIKISGGQKLLAVNGTDIAIKYFRKPITNTVMLGALSKATGIVGLEALKKAIMQRFSGEPAKHNIDAITECFNDLVATQ
ncbi:MAG: 2-oxoacid:acceptor oxidoreductase family protein [Candidatus Micrarchaeota archaeon]